MGIVFEDSCVMKNKFLFGLLLVCGIFWSAAQETPVKFLTHKVKKKETLYGITKTYNITQEQLYAYNPLLEKVGLRRRMILRIPVYETVVGEKVEGPPPVLSPIRGKGSKNTQTYIVKPKETKWRIAYNFQITIPELEALNPHIKEGLQIGQEIHLPMSTTNAVSSTWDSDYNYYTVLPQEGYYRIEKKIGVTQKVLDSLNPQLPALGLQAGMVLRVPGLARGQLKIEDDLLVERISLLDSISGTPSLALALLLPFKAKTIKFDSLEDTQKLLQGRNLHTLSSDFYSGVLLAADTLSQYGVSTRLCVFDTQNSISQIHEIINTNDFSQTDLIIGPLIPSNFDFLSTRPKVSNLPKVAPLSTNPVVMRTAVYQSVTPQNFLRKKMLEYLDKTLNREDNIVLVADSAHRSVERDLLKLFPKATILRPEKNNYLMPELVDSLLVDSLPNRVILESQEFPLISSACSQMSAQQSDQRQVQLFTTYRSNAYENPNLPLKQLGDLKFTYPADRHPLKRGTYNDFQNQYIRRFGKPPTRTAIRAYDLAMDLMLRKIYSGDLKTTEQIGETQYQEHRFNYHKEDNHFENRGYFLLQHSDYDIVELKK